MCMNSSAETEDYDPFGYKKYRYTVQKKLKESPNAVYKDGSYTIFLSTAGENTEDEPEPLIKFLSYVKAELKDSNKDFGDPYISQLQQSVKKIKADNEMGARYMLFGELLREEFRAGKAEGKAEGITESKIEDILELLALLAPVPEKLEKQVRAVDDTDVLSKLLLIAAKADSIEIFEKQFQDFM